MAFFRIFSRIRAAIIYFAAFQLVVAAFAMPVGGIYEALAYTLSASSFFAAIFVLAVNGWYRSVARIRRWCGR